MRNFLRPGLSIHSGLAFKHLRSFRDRGREGLRINLQLVCGDEGGVDLGDEEFLANCRCERGLDRLYKAALAGNGFDDAEVFQFGVGFGDSIAVQVKLPCQRPNGGQGVPRFKSPGGGGETDLIDQLAINGCGGIRINLKKHTVIGQYAKFQRQSSANRPMPEVVNGLVRQRVNPSAGESVGSSTIQIETSVPSAYSPNAARPVNGRLSSKPMRIGVRARIAASTIAKSGRSSPKAWRR